MKCSNHHRPGFAIVMTLIVISLAVFIVSYIAVRATIFSPYADLVIKREQAQELALSGIQIAMSSLAAQPPAEKKEEAAAGEKKKTEKTSDEQFLLQKILPTLNRWRTFALQDSIDGIDATIQLCVSCEEGKININAIYDFDTHEFVGAKKPTGNWDAMMQELCKRIESQTGAKDLFKALSAYLKKQTHPLNDVTELLTIKEFAAFRNSIFYVPPTQKTEKRPLYLTDIFTTQSISGSIEPWLFSDSLLGIFDLPRAEVTEEKKRAELVAKAIKSFKPSASWKDDWQKLLQPIYQKELQSLPKGIESLLSSTFTPATFCVDCEVKVGNVTQQVRAIVRRTKKSDENRVAYDIMIKKLYWL